MTTRRHDDPPTVAEIAALTARLRNLSHRAADAGPQERAAFIADKEALRARISAAERVDRDDGSGGVWQMPDEMRERAVRTADELAAGNAPPGQPDDLVALAERIGQLRATQGPSRTEEVISHAEAVERLAELGYDRVSAAAMVAEYLHETSRAVGVPVYQWGLDQYDVDDIAARYEWVNRNAGATLPQARQRAAINATLWSGRADHARHDATADPVHATHAAQQAELWSARARVPQPFTYAGDEVEADDGADEDADADEADLGSAWTDFYTDEEIAAMGDALDNQDVWEARQRLLAYHAGRGQQTTEAPETRTDGAAHRSDEEDRRQQLARWHAEDATTQVDAQGDDALGRGDLS